MSAATVPSRGAVQLHQSGARFPTAHVRPSARDCGCRMPASRRRKEGAPRGPAPAWSCLSHRGTLGVKPTMRTRIYAYAGARSTYARRSGNRRGDVHRALLQHDNIDVHQKSHLNEALCERRIACRWGMTLIVTRRPTSRDAWLLIRPGTARHPAHRAKRCWAAVELIALHSAELEPVKTCRAARTCRTAGVAIHASSVSLAPDTAALIASTASSQAKCRRW